MDALNNYFEQRDLIKDETEHLNHLARAFYIVGNNDIAEQLHNIAENIQVSVKSIGEAYSKETNEDLERNNKQLGELLSTMLHTGEKGE